MLTGLTPAQAVRHPMLLHSIQAAFGIPSGTDARAMDITAGGRVGRSHHAVGL